MNDAVNIIDIHDDVIGRLAVRIVTEHPHTDPVWYVPLSGLPAGVSRLVAAELDLIGWSVTNGAAATLTFLDGADANGPAVAVAAITAGGTDTHDLGLQGVRLRSGLTVNASAAGTTGAVFYRLAHRPRSL